MARPLKINHVRIYPSPSGSGFDIVVRYARAGIQRMGHFSTVGEALAAAWLLPNRNPGPVYVYDVDFPTSFANAMATSLEKLGISPDRDVT